MRLGIVPVGEFPLGKTTGKFEISAPSLAAPLVVNYEVYARRHPGWIAFCAGIGMLAGWLVRIGLQRRRDINQARVTASEALAALNAGRQAINDADFRQAIDTAITALRNAAAARDAAAVRKGAEDARKALSDAEAALGTRRKALADQILPFKTALQPPWILPPVATGPLASARVAVNSVVSKADAQDIRAANHAFTGEVKPAAIALANAASAWRQSAASYLVALSQSSPALADQGAKNLVDAVAEWRKRFAARTNLVDITAQDLNTELANTHAALDLARQIVKDVRAGTVEMAGWVAKSFVPPAKEPPFVALSRLAEEHAVASLGDLDDPEPARPNPAARRRDEIDAWMAAFLSAAPPPINLKPVRDSLESGHWVAAATAARALVPLTGTSGAGTGLGLEDTSTPPPATTGMPSAPTARGTVLGTSLVGGGAATEGLKAPPVLTGSADERAALTRRSDTAAFLQSAILFALFLGGAYTLYIGQWVGTGKEMLGIIAWAFATDLTADSVLAAFKKN